MTILSSRASAAVSAATIAIVLAACGGDPAPISVPADDVAVTAPPTDPPAPTATESVADPAPQAPVDAAVKISQTELGDVLSDPNGKTLYAFTNDVDAASTCYGTCAEAWPPVIVDADFIVSPGLDSGIFATTVRDDGQLQLVAGRFPLYLYAADAKPGDITGHGSGDVWFGVDTGGRIIGADGTASDGTDAAPDADAEAAAASTIGLAESDLGTILTDADGMTLYLFTDDEGGTPTCTGGCAQAWPPLLVDGEVVAPDGVDAALLSTVEHPDGGLQLKIGKWPLYRFASDTAPGDVTGQGSGDVWFVVAPDGTSIK